ncbi:MAG: tRNA(Ile)(2)-agmatinylcytidine synthase [Thermoplasmata archaeon]|nr:tRNA(Ile)(2)-agmatinylcytidine synthase [Thermoplasmata archaeon]
MRLGIDDTDSPKGGCTTFVLSQVILKASSLGFDLIGEPRLVRLNPNVPFKTRGNAALSATFGHGRGARRKVGRTPEGPLWAFERARELDDAQAHRLFEGAWETVLEGSHLREEGTDPALVATRRKLSSGLYWKAVRSVVPVDLVEEELRGSGALYRTHGSSRGLVGAAAAAAWPGTHPTWELISYRSPEREGSRRNVDAASVRRAEAKFPELFLCHDLRTRRLLVAPHTCCPILFGLRATRPGRLFAAARMVESEPVERSILFRTNQGSGDHIAPRAAADIAAFEPGSVRGSVSSPPRVLPGGHVTFGVIDLAGGALSCIAFEPTKELPNVARWLRPGDRVRVWGGRGEGTGFNLEGIEVLHWGRWEGRQAPPKCPECKRSASSLGRNRGYRCPKCRRRLPPEAAAQIPRRPPFRLGRFLPTPSARRHLARIGPESPLRLL